MTYIECVCFIHNNILYIQIYNFAYIKKISYILGYHKKITVTALFARMQGLQGLLC